MIDTLLKSEPMLRYFFDDKENNPKVVEKDMKNLVTAKLGSSVATMFFSSLVSKAKALTPEEMLSDDEKLSINKSRLESMSIAKKVQTCDLLISYLKENIEFLMLDSKKFKKLKKQMSVLVGYLDSSTKLLFAQNISAALTNDGNSMIEMLFDVFESGLIDMLDLSEQVRESIKNANGEGSR